METFLIDVPMPSMGATVNELTVIDIMVKVGDHFKKGDKIVELESDKSVFEFESPCDGVLQALQVRAGDIVPSGSPFMQIETSDESLKHLASGTKVAPATKTATAPARPLVIPPVPKPVEATPSPAVIAASPVAETGPKWTPRATKMAQEAGLDPATLTDIVATGPGGRVSGDDVATYLAKCPAAVEQVEASVPAVGAASDQVNLTVCIAGVGYAVPKNVRSTKDVLKEFPGRTEEEMIKLTGIRERRFAGEGETATDLAVIAVLHALRQAEVDVSTIDGVIMATIIPDQPVPAMASSLARKLRGHWPSI